MPKLSRKQDAFPWMKWYPDDWRSDNGLAMCSAEARGVWMEILMCMWTSNIRGVMIGDPVALARLTRTTVEEVQRALADLEKNHVFTRGEKVSRDLPSDAIVNRRMYREWRIQITRQESGRRGGEVGGRASGEAKSHPGISGPKPKENQRKPKQNAENSKQNQSKDDFTTTCNETTYDDTTKAKPSDNQSNSLGEARSQKPEDIRTPIPPVTSGAPIGPLAATLRGLMGGLTSGESEEAGRLHPAKAAEVEELTARCAASSLNPAAAGWWAEVLACYAEHGGCLRDVHDLLAEVHAGQNPGLGKDVGLHTAPQRWLRSKMTELLREKGLKWPKMPEEGTATQRTAVRAGGDSGKNGKTPCRATEALGL